MPKLRVGVQLHPQQTTYAAFAEAVRQADALGVDTIWHWDHFFPLYGAADGPHFEAYTLLTAMAMITQRAEVGCLVTCNNYRNSNLLADMMRTIDHISGGRAILGIGAGWFQRDYDEYGYRFGTWTDRFDAFEQNLPIIRERWSKLNPPPIRDIPILIGGGGEKKTLRLTALYADMWNGFGGPDDFRRKNEVLDRWCAEMGRDPQAIERTASINPEDIDRLDEFVDAGVTHMILGNGAPFEFDDVARMVAWRDQNSSQ
ncbi:MAG: LLM class F420-dependent oxidoreductase [Anaerolineales bacterium]|nr:LLM class F420-dependent oxidoreductase [Anaerolineales bacterium]